MQQFTFDTGRSHQTKYNGYTARTDTDRKRWDKNIFCSMLFHLKLSTFWLVPSLSEELESPNSSIAVLQISIPTTQLNHRNRQTENQ